MKTDRKYYEKQLKKLMNLANIRELRGLFIFTRAYLGIKEEVQG